MMNKQMITGFVIHCTILVFLLYDFSYSIEFYCVPAVVIFNALGGFLILMNQEKLGAWIFLISSALLIPIGLIGALGAKKILDKIKKEEFYGS